MRIDNFIIILGFLIPFAFVFGFSNLKESEKPKRQYVNGRVSESEAQPDYFYVRD